MPRAVRILLLILAVLLVIGLITLFFVYRATQSVPDWYRQAMQRAQQSGATDQAAARKASNRMEQRVADLVSAFETTGRWEIVFTEEQVNAWLAVGLKEKHPGVLPPQFSEPRVLIEPDGVTLACRAKLGGVSTVLSLKVDLFLSPDEPNVVAVRIRRARAGSLPWPLGQVVAGLENVAAQANVPLQRRDIEGDPVALIRIEPRDLRRPVKIEALQLDAGKIYVSGTTAKRSRIHW